MSDMVEIPRWLLWLFSFFTGWALKDMHRLLKLWWRS